MSDEGIESKIVGRVLRLLVGIAMTIEGGRHLIDSSPWLPAKTAGVVIGEVVFYVAMHLTISKFFKSVHPCVGAAIAVTPVALVFLFGGPAGSLGSLIFVGVSLVLTAIRADGGCEVMTLPGMILGNRTHLICIAFSPIDWVETKVSSLLRDKRARTKSG